MIFGTVFSMIFFRRDKNSSFKFSNFQTVIFISISEGRANVTIPNLHRSELLYFSIAFYAVGRADGRRLPAPLSPSQRRRLVTAHVQPRRRDSLAPTAGKHFHFPLRILSRSTLLAQPQDHPEFVYVLLDRERNGKFPLPEAMRHRRLLALPKLQRSSF